MDKFRLYETMRIVLCMYFMITISANSLAAEDTIYLGMVEDVPGVYSGEGHSTKVRAVFFHQGNHWQAFQSRCPNVECLREVTQTYPKEVTWYVGLDGRQLGQVTSRVPKEFDFYSHIGLQDITRGAVPVIGAESWEFSGFLGEQVHRPLVAVSRQSFRDPQGWRHYKATPEIVKQALELMRTKAPAVCRKSSNEAQPLIPFDYGKRDINIRVHKSSDGSLLLTVFIKNAFFCQGGDGDGTYEPQTFAISPTGESQYLGPGLIFLDAGDYVGNGTSEIVMHMSGYDKGGYILFSNTFKEEARFEIIYH